MQKVKPRRRTESLFSSKRYKHLGEKHIEQNESPYTRRTISISPKIHKWIQDFRADLMKEDPDNEYEYTTIVNYLMAYGMRYTDFYELNKEDHDFVNGLIGNKLRLGKHGIIDSLETLNRLADEEDESDESNSVKGKKKADIPELEQSSP